MDPEIERLVLRMRKQIYSDLEKGKQIMPRGWFFVNGKLGPAEIMIPFVERFFDSSQTKDLLPNYVAKKWAEYKGQGNYGLLAVVIMSDLWFIQRELGDMSKEDAMARYGNVVPRNEKDKKSAISFMVFMSDSKRIFMFPYLREHGRVQWGEPMENIELADFGRFKDMYPKQVEAPQSNV